MSRYCALFGECNLPRSEYGLLTGMKIELHPTGTVVHRHEAMKNLPKYQAHVQARQTEPLAFEELRCCRKIVLDVPSLKDTEHAPVFLLRNWRLQCNLACCVIGSLEQRLTDIIKADMPRIC